MLTIISFLFYLNLSPLEVNFQKMQIDTWNSIKDKTWYSNESPIGFGEQIVFYTDQHKAFKAIRQGHGSGRYVVCTYFYDVEVKNDSIFMKIEKGTESKYIPNELKLFYQEDKNIIIGENSNLKFQTFGNVVKIYAASNEMVNFEAFKNGLIPRKQFYD